MGGRGRGAGLLVAVLVALLVVLGGGPALAGDPRPTVDPSAPTPTSPHPGRPPQGEAPDGSTVGGKQLRTRGVVVARGTPPLPAGIIAPSWLVADAGTGTVLAAKDPHGRYYPASTLKTLTMLTLLPVLDPAKIVVGTADDERIEGTRVGLIAGGRYSVQLLYQALMLASGNDAANALARAAGGADRTVAAMNAKAEELGAFDTVAGTPSGLDVAGQSSSVYDLALIFRALLQQSRALTVLRTRTTQMPAVPGRTAGYQIQNKNPLLASYPGELGAKNGFTHAARHGFVTAAERGGRRLVVSILGSEATPLRAPDQAARLLDWGFSVRPGTAGVGWLVDPDEAAALATPTSAARQVDASPTPHLVADDADAVPPAAGRAGLPMPVLVTAGLVVVLAAALLARRRAARAVRSAAPSQAPPEEAAGPASSGASPSTPP
jgi:serine-type D-Ala-D-Ala carboxypeptidase (penicillin-binding protein 5/6)